VAIFGSEKWPVAIYIWPVSGLQQKMSKNWPEKVANWPDLETKVASKMLQNYEQNCQKS